MKIRNLPKTEDKESEEKDSFEEPTTNMPPLSL